LRFCVWNFNAEDAEGAEVRRELKSQRGGKTSGENDDAEERWSQPPSSFCARCGVAIRTRLSRSIPLASACRWSLAIAARDRSAKSANRTNVSKNPQKQGPAKLGVKDFLTFVYDTEPEWALLAVKAPVEQVAGAFVRFRKAERWLRDVPRKSAAEGDDMGFPLIALLQLKDNPWAVVLRDVCDLTDEGMHGVAQDAKALSSKLKTRAITFVGEDTSGAVDYAIFDGGKMLEHAQWESGGPFFLFKSTLRKRPALVESVDDEFADAVFREQGVYLPACYPQSKGKSAWLCVEKVSAASIERADLVDLGGEE